MQGALVITADEAFDGTALLDFWVNGDGVSKAAIMLHDQREDGLLYVSR